MRRFLLRLAKFDLDGFFGEPVGQLQILADFSPLVTVFHRFFRMIIGLSEGVLRVPDRFIYHFQCLAHSSISFLESETQRVWCQKMDRR